MKTMRLSAINEIVNGVMYSEDMDIDNVEITMRAISKSTLFVALFDEYIDTYYLIENAIKEGVGAIMTEKMIPGYPCIVVSDTKKAIIRLAEVADRDPNLTTIAITGSRGKTTVKELVSSIMRESYCVEENIGNQNMAYTAASNVLNLDPSTNVYIQEVSMPYVHESSCVVKPNIAVITNVRYTHMTTYKSLDELYAEKTSIVDAMPQGSTVLLNGDDEKLREYKNDKVKIVLYGIENEQSKYTAKGITKCNDGRYRFTVSYEGGKDVVICSQLFGRHNVINLLAAFAVGIEMGMAPETIKSGIEKYSPREYRQNIVKAGETTIIADCYNAALDSMIAGMNILMDVPDGDGEKTVILADMLELGEYEEKHHREIGKFINEQNIIRRVILFGDRMRYAYEMIDNPEISVSYLEWFSDLESIVKDELLGKRKAVLFKGSSGMQLKKIINRVFGINLWNRTDLRGFSQKRYLLTQSEIDGIKLYCRNNDIKRVALYGISNLELTLIETLDQAGLTIVLAMDKKADIFPEKYFDFPVITLEKFDEHVDMVLVGVSRSNDALVEYVKQNTKVSKTWTFADLYEKADCLRKGIHG